MAVTAQEVITAARDQHPAFTPQRTPDGVLLRQLLNFHKRLASDVTVVNSSVLAVEEVIDLTTYDFALGYAFPAHIYVLPDGEVEPANELDPGDRGRLWIIGQNVRLFSRPLRSGWFVQNQFWLNGNAQDWAGAIAVHIHYVPIPATPVELADDFDPMPDTAFEVLSSYAALVMAKRGHNDPTIQAIDVNQFAQDYNSAYSSFIMEQGGKKRARRIKTIDTFPGGA
jgi:hypothetical protein